MGLHQRPARPVLAAGAAGDLVEELEGPLGSTQVAAVQAEIGVDHRDQGEVGKVMAFRRHLGADQDIDLARDHAIDGGGRLVAVHQAVRGEEFQPRLGKQVERLLRQPLDARPAGDELVDGAAMLADHAPAARL